MEIYENRKNGKLGKNKNRKIDGAYGKSKFRNAKEPTRPFPYTILCF